MKNKLKILLPLIVLLTVTSSVRASDYASISSVVYPTTVIEDQVFNVIVSFNYEVSGCLSDKYVYLYYSTNDLNIDFTKYVGVAHISNTPSSISFSISCYDRNLAVGDIFRFRIRYWEARLLDGEPVEFADSMQTTGVYEITVVGVSTESTGDSSLFLLLPILVFAILGIISRSKKRNC